MWGGIGGSCRVDPDEVMHLENIRYRGIVFWIIFWKIVRISIGGIDFYAYVCYHGCVRW